MGKKSTVKNHGENNSFQDRRVAWRKEYFKNLKQLNELDRPYTQKEVDKLFKSKVSPQTKLTGCASAGKQKEWCKYLRLGGGYKTL